MNLSCLVCVGLTVTAISNAAAFAQSNPVTTQWLYEKCKSGNAASQDSCAAYLLGSANVMAVAGKAFREPPDGIEKDTVAALGVVGICSSSGNGAVLRQVFINWAEKNPLEWKLGATQGVMTAFQEAWPCTTQ